ncbi:MAG: hypothetical protein MJZ34_02965 [Paludibacteraceae bacterium]|nr:hypothetical protein [Paludibacteraceae bacterium]
MTQTTDTYTRILAESYATIGSNGTINCVALSFNRPKEIDPKVDNIYVSSTKNSVSIKQKEFTGWIQTNDVWSEEQVLEYKYPYQPTDSNGNEVVITDGYATEDNAYQPYTVTLPNGSVVNIPDNSWYFGVAPYPELGLDKKEVHYVELPKQGLFLWLDSLDSTAVVHVRCAADVSSENHPYPRYLYETVTIEYLSNVDNPSDEDLQFIQFTFTDDNRNNHLTSGFDHILFLHKENNTYEILADRPMNYMVEFPHQDEKTSTSKRIIVRIKSSEEHVTDIDFSVRLLAAYEKHVSEDFNDVHEKLQKDNFIAEINETSYTPKNFVNDDDHPNLKVADYQSYSYLMWYYWNHGAINLALKDTRWELGDFQGKSTSDFPGPFLGFNDQFGSYLYSYLISGNKMLIILAGSNQYHHVDFYLCNLPDDFNTDNVGQLPYNRLLINRWFNSLYFVQDKKCYTVNPDIDTVVIRNGTYVDVTDKTGETNWLESDERLFKDCDINELSLDDQSENDEFYQTTFSDLGDCIIRYNTESKDVSIVGLIADNDVNTNNIDKVKTLSVFENNDITGVFNQYMIDATVDKKILSAMYKHTAWQIKYLRDHQYEVFCANNKFTIGKSVDESHIGHMLLSKVPGKDSTRIRYAENFTENLYAINESYFIYKDENGFIKKHIFNESEDDVITQDGYLITDRRCCVCSYKIDKTIVGYYRWNGVGNE